MNEADTFALVPRPPSTLEKVEPGAKRILSDMVADTLTLVKKGPLTTPVFTVLSGLFFGLHESTELILKYHFGQRCDLRFLRFGYDGGFYMKYANELLRLARDQPFDLIVLYSRLPSDEAELFAQLKAEYGKPIIVASGMSDVETAKRAERAGVAFLPCPYSVKQFLEVLEACLNQASDAAVRPNKPKLRAKPKIVMLDDDPMILDVIEVITRMRFNDAMVLKFDDANEALRELAREEPDVFTTDWVHPKISGAEMLRLLAERKAAFPILVMSGYATEAVVRGCTPPNLKVTFLRKPFTPLTFVRSLESALEIPSIPDWSPSRPLRTRPPRIVLVDDDSVALDQLEFLVRLWFKEATVLKFEDGNQALQELSRTEPDLLITDVMRPRCGLLEMLPFLAQRKVKYPVLVVSTVVHRPTQELVRDAVGAKLSFLRKPFTKEQIHLELLIHVGPRDQPDPEAKANPL